MSPNPRPVYLVVGKFGLVLDDLCAIITEIVPAAQVIMVDTLSAAIDALTPITNVATAFVESDLAQFSSSDLAKRLSDDKSKIVLMGHDAEENAAQIAWSVLERPFTSDDVKNHLE